MDVGFPAAFPAGLDDVLAVVVLAFATVFGLESFSLVSFALDCFGDERFAADVLAGAWRFPAEPFLAGLVLPAFPAALFPADFFRAGVLAVRLFGLAAADGFRACLAVAFDAVFAWPAGFLAGPAGFAAFFPVLAAARFEAAFFDAAFLDAACLVAFFRAAEVFTAELALVVARAEIGFRLLAAAFLSLADALPALLAVATLLAARRFGAASSFDMAGCALFDPRARSSSAF